MQPKHFLEECSIGLRVMAVDDCVSAINHFTPSPCDSDPRVTSCSRRSNDASNILPKFSELPRIACSLSGSLSGRSLRGALAGSFPQELALGGVLGQRRGALELGARLHVAAEFSQQIGAHGRQQVEGPAPRL